PLTLLKDPVEDGPGAECVPNGDVSVAPAPLGTAPSRAESRRAEWPYPADPSAGKARLPPYRDRRSEMLRRPNDASNVPMGRASRSPPDARRPNGRTTRRTRRSGRSE